MAFPLAAETTAGEVEEFYGIHLDPDPARTLGDLLAERLGKDLAEGAEVEAGEFRLAAHTVVDGVVTVVDVEVLTDTDGGHT
jgi:CBS domain containing-hemolysin-like protein